MPQALEHGATCFQGTHLSLRCERTREMNLHSSSQCSILFFFFCRRWAQVVKCLSVLIFSALSSGLEGSRYFGIKWDRSELMI